MIWQIRNKSNKLFQLWPDWKWQIVFEQDILPELKEKNLSTCHYDTPLPAAVPWWQWYWQDRPGLPQQPRGVFSSLVHLAASWQLLVHPALSWQLLVLPAPSWQLLVHLAHGSICFLFPAPTWPQNDQPPLPEYMIIGRQAVFNPSGEYLFQICIFGRSKYGQVGSLKRSCKM